MKIEQGVPIPKLYLSIYPFAEMVVGDSFLVPLKERHRAASAVSSFARKHPGVKFVTRKVAGGIRVWRVK